MHLLLPVFLWWSAGAGLVFSLIVAPSVMQNKAVKLWHRGIFCALIGPAFWLVLAAALIVAAVTFLIQCERLRRAKKPRS